MRLASGAVLCIMDPWEDYSLSDADEAMRKLDEILLWIAPLSEAGEHA